MSPHRRLLAWPIAAALLVGAPVAGSAADTGIDVQRSTLTVFAFKSGLFSAFADDHTIRAPIASGAMSEEAPLSITLTVRSDALEVLDPGLSAARRSEVQARMLGPEVLDVERFPEITFQSASIEPAGTDRWTVTGRVVIHGQAKTITFPVTRRDGTYRGSVTIKQRDFGITPITVAGGTVKVKDELRIEFAVAPSSK
jgi:polyisoprenoid-binding protein YceI